MAEKPTYEELKKRVQELEQLESKSKGVKEELRESHQIITGIIDAIPVRVFWKDKNLVYLGCNTIFAHDAGFADPKDLIGKDDYQMVWRDQAELYRGDDRQVIHNGNPKLLIEEPQTTPEGNTITLLTSKVPLRSSTGEISGVLGTYMDISDRKQAEETLREAEEMYRTLFESSRDAIMTLAPPTWFFTSGNPATMELFRAKDETEFISFGPWQLSPERQPDGKPSEEKAKEMIETAMRNGSHFFKWTHCHSDGTPFPAEVLLTRVEQRAQVFLQATVRNITERKQAEEEREILISKLQKTLSEVKTLRGFLPICSHCKKIRDDKGYWNKIESYIHKHSVAKFSHGICPECEKKHFPEYADDDE
jgi:PAS domain S-box-containing protein